MRHQSFLNLVFITSGLVTALSAHAESALDPVIVTATRHTETIDETMASVTVITRKDIESGSATDLNQLLSRVPGIDFKPSGAYGKTTSLFMRGTGSGHVLTLIDGVKIYSATSGSTAFQHLPLSQIERIEIVRGPRSSLYGSEAIGGVIQIFTRKGHIEPSSDINISMASQNTTEITAGISNTIDKLTYSLHGSQFETDGIDAKLHDLANDNDGYNNKSISSHIGYVFDKGLSLDLHFMNAKGTTLYDSCYNASYATSDDCFANFVQQSFSSKLTITPEGYWDSSLQAGITKDLSDNYWEGDANNLYKTDHLDLAFINNFQITDAQLFTLGIDFTKDIIFATPYDSTTTDNRNNSGIFAQWDAAYKQFDLNTSLRSDDNQQFGTHTTGNIAVAYTFPNQLRLITSYGSAFKAPSFNDLYYPYYGSPDLKPEESSSVEISLNRRQDWGYWTVSLYQTRIDNMIAYNPDTFLAGNISKANIEGIETSLTTQLRNWQIDLSASFIDPINEDEANKDKVLVARAKQTASISARRNFGKIDFATSVLAQSKRYTKADNSKSEGGYAIVDFNLGYQLDKHTRFSTKINNALDKNYEINPGFNTLGRTLSFNLQYSM